MDIRLAFYSIVGLAILAILASEIWKRTTYEVRLPYGETIKVKRGEGIYKVTCACLEKRCYCNNKTIVPDRLIEKIDVWNFPCLQCEGGDHITR